ncbi:glycosyltransferase family 61 protein [Hymenobacter lucidus]|uniref:glycosyltransferase family 61 protein n=1 Tax=Hymenobacter lucidus TaxID=2880930 RepID=UPI001CF2F285
MPHNLRFRPVGVHGSSQQLAAHPGSGATYREIYPAYLSQWPVTDKLYAQISDYGGLHAKPNRTEKQPAAFVLTLEQGRLLADNTLSVAVLSADNKLVGDASFQYDVARADLARPEDNTIFGQRWFKAPVQVRGTVCSLLSGGGAATGNYYHWLIDSLPRLHLVQEAGLWESIDYFLIYDKKRQFVVDSLLALGIRSEQIVDVSTHGHLVADRLLVTSPVRGQGTHNPEWACDFLRQALLPAAAPQQFSPYVYLSRRDAPGRHVLNEDHVEEMLAPYGFESHVLSDYTFTQQIALFAGAKMVVAPTGAGLANLVFAPVGTPVIEMFPKHFTVMEYPELCYRLGLSHQFLVSEPVAGPIKSRREAWSEHLLVNLETLKQELRHASSFPRVATVLCLTEFPDMSAFVSPV